MQIGAIFFRNLSSRIPERACRQAQQILEQRAKVLESAFKDHEKWFKGKMPKSFLLLKAVFD
jgi:hypothetical protein